MKSIGRYCLLKHLGGTNTGKRKDRDSTIDYTIG